MAKPLADCRVRVEFPRQGKTYNIGLFYNPISRKMILKMGDTAEEVTPSQLGQRIGKWIGEGVRQ